MYIVWYAAHRTEQSGDVEKLIQARKWLIIRSVCAKTLFICTKAALSAYIIYTYYIHYYASFFAIYAVDIYFSMYITCLRNLYMLRVVTDYCNIRDDYMYIVYMRKFLYVAQARSAKYYNAKYHRKITLTHPKPLWKLIQSMLYMCACILYWIAKYAFVYYVLYQNIQ